MSGHGVLLIAAVALTSALGCSPGDSTASRAAAAPAWALEKTFNEGTPVTLTLRLDRTQAGLADKLILEQELTVDPGFEAELPEYLPEDFDGFSVVEIHSPRTAVSAGADTPSTATSPSKRTKRLTLEPDRSGALSIQKLVVYFNKSGENTEQFFETEEIPVEIAPVSNLKDLQLEPLRDIYETAPISTSRQWLWIISGAAGLALAAGIAGYYSLRRRALAPPPTPPHEIAYDALRRLVSLELIEKGHVELFFVHLSAILRDYIERRFSVHAPERTTEEFLDEAARNQALSSHRTRLSQFLKLCDQVKFARYEPDEQAIQNAFDVVKKFIAETTPAEGSSA